MAGWNHDFPGNHSPADIDFLTLLSPSDMDNTSIFDWITEGVEEAFMEDYYDPDLIAALDASPNGTETAGTEQNPETTFNLPNLYSTPQTQPHLWKGHDEAMMDGFDMDLLVFEPEPVIGNATIQPQLLSWTNKVQQGPEPPDPPHNIVRIDPTPTTMLLEPEHSTNGRRRQPRIGVKARDTMLEFYRHTPYPTAENFEILALETNLEVRRVRNWFNNHRSRQGRVDDNAASIISGERPVAVLSYLQPSQTRLSKESLESVASHYSLHQQPPLEAWISSSLESDPVPVANIKAAVAKSKTASIHSGPPHEDTSSHSEVYKASSAKSSQASQASSNASRYTVSSRGSHISATSRTSRRGRRRVAPYPPSLPPDFPSHLHKDKYKEELPYMCTFRCGKRFKKKYDWVRHEETVHLPQKTWVCCANNLPSLGNCPYCSAESPDRSHIEGHGFGACKARSLEKRTFYRRDNFVEHIHKVHGNGEKHPSTGFGCPKNSGYGCSYLADKWKQKALPISPDDPVLNCGFCGERLSTWEKRRDHVSNHFASEKRDMSLWWPARKPVDLQVLTSTISMSDEGPCICRYCHELFPDGRASHYSCSVWSCRFLESAYPLADDIGTGNFTFPSKSYLKRGRGCTQDLFTSTDAFFGHLYSSHKLNLDAKWNYPEFRRQFSRSRRAEFEPARNKANDSEQAGVPTVLKEQDEESGLADVAGILKEQDEESAPHYLLLRLPKGIGDEFAQLPVSNVERAGPVSSKDKHRLSTLLRKVLQSFNTDSLSRR